MLLLLPLSASLGCTEDKPATAERDPRPPTEDTDTPADTADTDTPTDTATTPDTADTATATAAPAAPPPNLLVIVTDDMGVDKVGVYATDVPGYAELAENLPSTPRIDELAASGLRFTNAWANPTCSPTRAGIQTGRHAFRTGVG